MRRYLRTSSALAFAIASSSGIAQAQSDEAVWPEDSIKRPAPGTAWRERPVAIEGHIGAGTPVGQLGVTADYSFLPEIAVGGGVGFGSGLETPTLHTAAIVRLRPLYGIRNAFVANVAYSTGGHKELELDLGMGHGGPQETYYGAERAHWFQFDLGWERRAKSGFILRISSGFARMLNPGDLECVVRDPETFGATTCEVPDDATTTLFTMDLALGTSF